MTRRGRLGRWRPGRGPWELRDVKDVRSMEAEQRRLEKLEALGTLAGGMAHAFNNLLTTVLGNITLARLEAGPEEAISDYLAEAEKAVLEAADLTSQLLTFGSGGAPLRTAVTVDEVLAAAGRALVRSGVAPPELEAEEEPWVVHADPEQLASALRNVILNAHEAAGGGGTVEIRARNEEVGEGAVPALAAGRYVHLEVRDDGPGIPEDTLSRVFEPYYSTRKGATGLGLPTAFSILRRHEGYLTLDTKAGEGTTAHIYVPAADETREVIALRAGTIEEEHGPRVSASPAVSQPPAPAGPALRAPRGSVVLRQQAQSEEPSAAAAGSGPAANPTLLLVDDEEGVRTAAESLLSLLGWSVTTARDGREAVRLYEEALRGGEPFDAVILDLTVHEGMGGRATIQRLRALDPDVRALVSSGYHNHPILARFWEYGFSGAVPKPYTLRALDETVCAVARRSPEGRLRAAGHGE